MRKLRLCLTAMCMLATMPGVISGLYAYTPEQNKPVPVLPFKIVFWGMVCLICTTLLVRTGEYIWTSRR